MIRLEIEGTDTADFMKNLGGFLVMLQSRQQPTADTPKAETKPEPDSAPVENNPEPEIIPLEKTKRGRPSTKKAPEQIDIEQKIAEPQEPEATFADVKTVMVDLLKHTDEATLFGVLRDVAGVEKLSKLDAGKYREVIEAAKAKIDAAKGA